LTSRRFGSSRGISGLVVLLLATLGAGCASRASVRQLQEDVTALKADRAAVRQAQDAAARDTGRASASLQAVEGRLDRLSGAVNATIAGATEFATRLAEAERAIQALRTAVEARLSAPPPPPAPERPQPPAPPLAGSPEAHYAAALATFRAREHGQAILDFLDFLARYPKHALAPNAQFWIGEAYYAERDWRQALAEFEKVADQPPASPKRPDALLKVGLCYASLKETARARQVWQALVREYPDSEAAGRARGLLAPPKKK
jgi:tol-pal system protein YbgF